MMRTVGLEDEERRLLMELLGHVWQQRDDERTLSPFDSPQEAAALADQKFIEAIQAKLR